MIEELVKQFETELMTQETEPADETETTDNVETGDTEQATETDESQKPVSIVQSIVSELEKELMTDKPNESANDDEPSDDDEQGGQDESEPSDDDEQESGQDVPADESEPSEEAEPSETESGQLDEIVKALEDERKKLENERQEWQKKIEEAEQRAKQSERQMKRLVLSHALANRNDLTDKRLIAELVDVDSLEVGDDGTIEEAVTNRINEVVQKYGNVLAKKKGEKYIARDIGGMTTYEKVKPIGRATSRADSPPIDSKQELLEEAKKRAEKGGQKERVEYLALQRQFGLK